jgi:hypothetical protein
MVMFSYDSVFIVNVKVTIVANNNLPGSVKWVDLILQEN